MVAETSHPFDVCMLLYEVVNRAALFSSIVFAHQLRTLTDTELIMKNTALACMYLYTRVDTN